ncbi:MAG: family 20 glycosylhydrolase [Candidatus Aminicenantes bacterium]|nr:family 20 glycosylhydrolase [Candidatus Aminicenantes bacterium]
MKKIEWASCKIFIVFLLLASLIELSSFSASSSNQIKLNVIPRPLFVSFGRGNLNLKATSSIIINQNLADLRAVASELQRKLQKATGWPWEIKEVSQVKTVRGHIFLRLLPERADLEAEGYELRINDSHITLDSKKVAGLFYGIQTLWQILPASMELVDLANSSETAISPSHPPIQALSCLTFPLLHVVDKPRFRWRGVHLDCSRHFFPKEWIKKLLETMAAYKLNTFHWHLTDDQGWRIEIKKYPRLTEIGAWRRETMEDGQPYGGFYTQEDIKEIIEYAQKRFITVVPEIEMPGHCLAALAAYPELSCSGGPFKVGTEWGVMNDVFCPGSEETFAFLENVLGEVIELFPSDYIHIGGDEVPKIRWKNCLRCQTRIKTEGLKDESELQSYFIKRIEAFLNSRGKRLIGWDEILEGGLAPRATVMSWRGMAGGITAARNGHDVIMSPTSHCYFDYYQGLVDEPKAIGGFLPLEKVYTFEPVPAELKPEEARHILGAQANLWTEYIKTPEQAEYMLFPRLLALAEVVWSPKQRDWADFQKRIFHHFDRLALKGVNFRVPPPEGVGGRRRIIDPIILSLVPPIPSAKIVFTLDGQKPTPNSPIYSGPLEIKDNTIFRAATLLPNGRMSHPVSMYFFKIDETINGLNYDYYEGQWERLPDLDKEKPLYSGITYDLTLDGLKTAADYFALRFRGKLLIEQEGEYIFYTRADDGLRLKINDQVVAENWGLFGQREVVGRIKLSVGRHDLQIDFFEKRGRQSLEIFIEGPGFPYQPLPPAYLFRN